MSLSAAAWHRRLWAILLPLLFLLLPPALAYYAYCWIRHRDTWRIAPGYPTPWWQCRTCGALWPRRTATWIR